MWSREMLVYKPISESSIVTLVLVYTDVFLAGIFYWKQHIGVVNAVYQCTLCPPLKASFKTTRWCSVGWSCRTWEKGDWWWIPLSFRVSGTTYSYPPGSYKTMKTFKSLHINDWGTWVHDELNPFLFLVFMHICVSKKAFDCEPECAPMQSFIC